MTTSEVKVRHAHSAQTIQQFLTFRLAEELFSVGIEFVKEIIEYNEVTEVPAMPAQIRGVINLRGQAVPVVDLLACFGRGRSTPTRRTCIVIVEMDTTANTAEHQLVGIMVDTVNEVLDVDVDDIQPPPKFGTSMRSDFVRGMGQVRGKFIMILDMDRILRSLDEANAGVLFSNASSAGNSAGGASSGTAACPTLDAVLKDMRAGQAK